MCFGYDKMVGDGLYGFTEDDSHGVWWEETKATFATWHKGGDC